MLEAAGSAVVEIGQAKVGDKTLIDTLHPAIAAYRSAINEGSTFQEALQEMKQAARNGRDSTMNLVAKMGRASRLGERSRGFLDAGATSCCLILESMADSIEDLLK